MHASAFNCGAQFFSTYWQGSFKRILDIGSMDVIGSLRAASPPGVEYVGIDLQEGPGVDMVLEDPYSYPFPDEYFDCIVSTSCYEHDRMFWLTFLESCRVLSRSGYIHINAPSSGDYHGYPYDHWRFYPDAGVALEAWGQRMQQPIRLVESFLIRKDVESFGDCTMIFTKDGPDPESYLFSKLPNVVDVRKGSLLIQPR